MSNNNNFLFLIAEKLNFGQKEFNGSYLWLFGLVGLAYCYLASSPILVLHAFRFSIFNRRESEVNESNRWYKKWLMVIVYGLTMILLGIFLFLRSGLGAKVFGSIEFWILMLLFLLQSIIISLQLYLRGVFIVYKRLSVSRANANENKKEYIESYRHLREHGNAFLILIMELILGFILYNIGSPMIAALIIFIWILPAGVVWFLGSYLESRLNQIW